MKTYLNILLLISFSISYGQVGIGTTNPSPASMLEISGGSPGNYRGFMPPRVSSISDRNSIPATVSDAGLIVFVTGTGCLDIWNGFEWENFYCTGNVLRLWVNEFHYDNDGGDIGEFIEVAGVAGTDLSGYTIVLYNDGATYGSVNLSGFIPDQSGTGYGVVDFLRSPIQNGPEDGFALVNPEGEVLQLLSYEGTFEATNGPAIGMLSTDVGLEETDPTGAGGTPVGDSLQLIGTGNTYSDFSWLGPSGDSRGTINTGQTFN